MRKFNLNVDEELLLLEKYNLTPDELFTIKVLFLAVEDEQSSYAIRFLTLNRDNFRNLLVSLQNKGIILKSYKIPQKGETFIPNEVQYNKNFIKNLYQASFELGSELYDHYPMSTVINGCITTLRGVSKKFNSLEDAFRAYGKAIKWNMETHKEIIELVEWAKDNNILSCSLATFIVDNKWNDLRALKDGVGLNYNTDSIRLL